MANPLFRVLGNLAGNRRAVESIVPRRTFDDVVLPPSTRRALDQALAQVTSHDLIFNRWGLGERHPTGLALAFNFAGPSGTGKTICAEAIAHALGRRLLLVRYADVESMWMGETPKNVATVFRLAREEDAVLLFDEADAIASRRSSSVEHGMQRESNTVVNVMLQELETFNGVVIFTTNLAANFDPAFERRIRTHVLFEMPGVDERERIWKVQLHPTLTPLADDVDFRALAENYAVSGGDIRNAVLKAALAAASEPASDAFKVIHQRHLEDGIRDVVAGRQVMRQSLFNPGGGVPEAAATAAMVGAGADALSAPNGAAMPADPVELMLSRLAGLQRIAIIAAAAGGASLIVAIVALIVALLR
jgi:SpoVK/Ycf46/Vps4 family AAA+-type ATPase